MRIRATFFIPVAVVTLGGAILARTDAPPVAASVLSTCAFKCRMCPDEERHEIIQAVDSTHSSSHLENCNPSDNNCDDHACEPNFAAVVEAVDRLASNLDQAEGRKDVIRALKPFGRLAYVNNERQSVQLWGCDGVIASIPLRPSVFAAYAEE